MGSLAPDAVRSAAGLDAGAVAPLVSMLHALNTSDPDCMCPDCANVAQKVVRYGERRHLLCYRCWTKGCRRGFKRHRGPRVTSRRDPMRLWRGRASVGL